MCVHRTEQDAYKNTSWCTTEDNFWEVIFKCFQGARVPFVSYALFVTPCFGKNWSQLREVVRMPGAFHLTKTENRYLNRASSSKGPTWTQELILRPVWSWSSLMSCNTWKAFLVTKRLFGPVFSATLPSHQFFMRVSNSVEPWGIWKGKRGTIEKLIFTNLFYGHFLPQIWCTHML